MLEPSHILIVDDDISIRRVLALQLAHLGYKADSATNGLEALRLVHKWHYDLILMDVQMPHMNGLEATAAIRTYEESEGLDPSAIIGVTAGGATRKQCIDMGMSDYLQKPLLLETLSRVVNKWLAT